MRFALSTNMAGAISPANKPDIRGSYDFAILGFRVTAFVTLACKTVIIAPPTHQVWAAALITNMRDISNEPITRQS
jgi:hypothetical protein